MLEEDRKWQQILSLVEEQKRLERQAENILNESSFLAYLARESIRSSPDGGPSLLTPLPRKKKARGNNPGL